MTKAFRFRLERLLSLRRLEEREAEAAAREAALRLGRAEEACDALRSARAEAWGWIARGGVEATARPDGPRLMLEHGARLDGLLERREAERDAARKAAVAADEARRRARVARKALDEIEARAKSAWRAEAARDEAAFMDEVAAGRFAAARRS